MPLVSVIINCHNGAEYLPEALDSVRRQTFPDYEIVFWDNKSGDGSGEIARSYGEPLSYFRSEEFLPLGAARNAAISKAQGKYIALLDCDDIWLPEKLEKQVALLESDPDLALVYSNVYLIDEKGKGKEGTHFDRVKPYSEDVFLSLLSGENPIICSTVIFKKDVFEHTGGFNPELSIAEEYDLFLRMTYRHRVSFLSTPLAKLRQYDRSYSRRNQIKTSREKIEVLEKSINMMGTVPKQHAGKIKKKLARVSLGLVLAHVEEREYARALVLPVALIRKYAFLSAKLKGRSVN